jgi:predicted negative regulator of RcsB-dependent stress response
VTQEREPAERIRNLLLRGDNLLKHGGDRDKALAAFEEARQVAADESVEPRVRQLVEHRIASLDELLGE